MPALRGKEGGQGRRGVSLQAAGRAESFGDAGSPPSSLFFFSFPFFFLTLHFLYFFQNRRAQLVIAVANGTKRARVCLRAKRKAGKGLFLPREWQDPRGLQLLCFLSSPVSVWEALSKAAKFPSSLATGLSLFGLSFKQA